MARLEVTLLEDMVAAMTCLVAGHDQDCESKFWLSASKLPMGLTDLRSWVEEVWLPAGIGRSSQQDDSALHLALFIGEVLLDNEVIAFLSAATEPSKVTDFRASVEDQHWVAAKIIRAHVDERSARTWAQGRASSLQIFSGDFLSRPFVDIAMVASVGLPVFAEKAVAGVRSALFFAKERPLRFHFFVDQAGGIAMRTAVSRLEPWLAAKASFLFHGRKLWPRFFKRLHTLITSKCASRNPYYGDAGWVRLFVHDVLAGVPDLELLIFVDAGDFVFLEDPALILQHRLEFKEEHLMGSPYTGVLNLQLYDIPRMQRVNFTRLLVQMLPDDAGRIQCKLAEGSALLKLSSTPLWHHFDSAWSFEPREIFSVFGDAEFYEDQWHNNFWNERIYAGVRDWTHVVLGCPSFTTVFLSFLATAGTQPLHLATYGAAIQLAKHMHSTIAENVSFEYPDVGRRCGQKILGIHFPVSFKAIPWCRELLQFWAGGTVWGRQASDDYKERSHPSADSFIVA